MKWFFRGGAKKGSVDQIIQEEHIPLSDAVHRCSICGATSIHLLNGVIMERYPVQYFFCAQCEHLETEKPYWLREAYQEPITLEDTGILQRNLENCRVVSVLLDAMVGPEAKGCEYAGGYGVLTRLLRDVGFDFYWTDRYAQNIFARCFEYDPAQKMDVVVAFEAFEHFEDFQAEFEKIRAISSNIVFSQTLLPTPVPAIDHWWYYAARSGQHIRFYREKTFTVIAKKYGLRYLHWNDIHMFTAFDISQERFCDMMENKKKLFTQIQQKMISRTVRDREYCLHAQVPCDRLREGNGTCKSIESIG